MSDPREATQADPHPVSGHRTPREIAKDEAGPIGQADAEVVARGPIGQADAEVVAIESDNGLLVRPVIAEDQLKRFSGSDDGPTKVVGPPGAGGNNTSPDITPKPGPSVAPKRFHGTVSLDPTRLSRDAGRIAEEILAHLAGLVGSEVNVTLDIDALIPNGAPPNVVRTVTENSTALRFDSHGFERE